MLHNPLLPGFYPDPSICRRGNDLYMVTSSFEYFPGVPIFHSRDMVHWHQIGHCLDRPEQLNLDGVMPSKGIYAPTIRYHTEKKLFYMITTLVQDSVYKNNINFYVTATDPAGPWSAPVVIDGAEGIDPTLFFDGDKAYYLGNMRPHPEIPDCTERWIWLQELELPTGRLMGERKILLRDGAFCGAATPEGPHLYHIGAWYYLMIAEGGTSWNHAETIFRSRSLDGPWEANPRNPLITHRNLGKMAQIDSTGHADLIQLPNGEWWAVMLASRAWRKRWHLLGRETFAVPVTWEDDWPVFSPETGRVEMTYPAPALPACPQHSESMRDDFNTDTLAFPWNMLRTPHTSWYSLTDRPGWLRLDLRSVWMGDGGNPSLIVRRVQHFCFFAEAKMAFSPNKSEAAGLLLMMNETHFIALLRRSEMIVVIRRCGDETQIVDTLPYTCGESILRMECRGTSVLCSITSPKGMQQTIFREIDGSCLTVESAGGFTGTYVGLYAYGSENIGWADFDWFEYGSTEDLQTSKAMRAESFVVRI